MNDSLSVWSLHILSGLSLGSSTVQRHAISEVRLSDDSKLLIGVKVSVHGCLSLCGSPATHW